MPIACRELSQDHFQRYMSKNDRVDAVNVSGGKGCRVNHKSFMHDIITHNAVKYMAIGRMPECIIYRVQRVLSMEDRQLTQ
jgi:uncharacterized protein